MIKTVGELKRLLENIDDDATIVLQVEEMENGDTYIGMNDDLEVEYDDATNVIILMNSLSDIVNIRCMDKKA